MYLNSGSLILTENCNLNCSYCYENRTRQNNKTMNIDVAKAAIDFMIQEGLRSDKKFSVTYFGGEPLLNLAVMNESFDYAMRRSKEENIAFSCKLVTNSTIYNKEYEAFLQKWHDQLGRVNIQLSIDGMPEIQNLNRRLHDGNESSDLVEKSVAQYLNFFKQNNIPVNDSLITHSCVSVDNVQFMYDNYEYFKNLGFQRIWFLPIQEQNWESDKIDIFIEQLQKIADENFEDCRLTRSLDAYKSFTYLNRNFDKHPLKPCGAGYNHFTVSTVGEIYPCHRFMFYDKESIVGNVWDGIIYPDKRQIFLDYSMQNMFGDKMCIDQCNNKNCYRCLACNKEHNGNMLIGFYKYCNLARQAETIKKELRRKLAGIRLLKEESEAMHSNECSQSTVDEIVNILTPVIQKLDENLKAISDNTLIHIKAIKRLEDKFGIVFEILNELAISLSILGHENYIKEAKINESRSDI